MGVSGWVGIVQQGGNVGFFNAVRQFNVILDLVKILFIVYCYKNYTVSALSRTTLSHCHLCKNSKCAKILGHKTLLAKTARIIQFQITSFQMAKVC